MSGIAALLVDFTAAPPLRVPLRTVRPRLTVVPPVGLGAGQGGAVGAVRLTRRGRLTVTLAVAGAIAVAALVLLPWSAGGVSVVDHSVTVRSGQTLSEIAAAELPSLPLRRAIAELQLVNGMNTTQVQKGQTLLVPSVP